jgi:hypothetical protein
MEELKRVIYTMERENAISPFAGADEKEQEELEEQQRTRDGLFHRWGDSIRMFNDKYYAETYGIVQDIETGKIKSVCPKRIKFVE